MKSQSQSTPASLPYEVYEIRAKAVIGGTVLPVSYIGTSLAGDIHQAVTDHLALETTSNIVLWHCLHALPDYSVYSRGEAASKQAAADLVRSLIAARPLVLNEYGTAWAGNSVYRQYLTEQDLEQMDYKSRVQRCLACGESKKHSEFSRHANKLRTDCKECINDQRKRCLSLAEYRQFRLNGWLLPSQRPVVRNTNRPRPVASKKCYCCCKVKKSEEFWANPLIRDGLQPSCKACYKEQRKLKIKMKELKERKRKQREDRTRS